VICKGIIPADWNTIIIIDLKKAFDTIDHEILLGKLNRYGFSNQTVELFRNYLSGRTQITVINNVSSGSCKITCGVPQGSYSGPATVLTLYQ
jgi:retron-type reverse transcriptase